jgi:hypothetical protein
MHVVSDMQSAFQYAKVYTNDGTLLGAVGVTNDYGIQVQLPAMLYIDSIPAGQFYL